MAYAIINNIIPGLPKEPYRYGVGAYEGVVAHATAVYAPDENQVQYFLNNWKTREAFVQFFVDWDSIRQTSDMNYKAWGAGPTANKRYVHVELCQTKDHALFLESYKRYVWLLAWILRRKNLGVTDGKTLVSHDWCSRTFKDTTHTDPIGYLAEHGVSWAKLVADVKAAYAGMDANGNPLSVAKPAPAKPAQPAPADRVTPCVKDALAKLKAAGVSNNPEYWENVLGDKAVLNLDNLAALIKNMAAKL